MTSNASAITVGHAPLVIPCGSDGTAVPAGWFFPDRRRPTGVVWVQHGFFRAAANVLTLARYIAGHTGAVVVAPTVSSNPFTAAGCWINGPPMAQGVAALFAGSRKALQRSADTARGHHVTLPRPFVLTGHSAGGNLATSAAGATTLPGGAIRHLRGVVLYDAVDFDGAIATALGRLSGSDYRPVLQIAAPPSTCNAFGSGTNALVTARVEASSGFNSSEGPTSTPRDPTAIRLPGSPVGSRGRRTSRRSDRSPRTGSATPSRGRPAVSSAAPQVSGVRSVRRPPSSYRPTECSAAP